MIRKIVINPDRIRAIKGGFSFIPHRFVTDGFLSSLGPTQLLLYLFLVLVSDRYGLSYYAYDSICSLLKRTLHLIVTFIRHATCCGQPIIPNQDFSVQ